MTIAKKMQKTPQDSSFLSKQLEYEYKIIVICTLIVT